MRGEQRGRSQRDFAPKRSNQVEKRERRQNVQQDVQSVKREGR